MEKRIFLIGLGVMMLSLWFPAHTNAIRIPPINDVYYYIHVDTSSVDAGFLRRDSTSQKVLADTVKGDYALWKFKLKATDDYYIINKKTGDTLAFDIPAANEPAIITAGGSLNVWMDLFTMTDAPDSLYSFVTAGTKYYLTLANQAIYISPATSSLKRMTFRTERPKFIPNSAVAYRIKVDTLGTPLTDSFSYLWGNVTTSDSLVVDTTRNDFLSLWRFVPDGFVNDTAVYKIYNKQTGRLLAFNVPTRTDTIAKITNTGKLDQWRMPFFDNNRTGMLTVRDTSTKKDYYLGLTPDSVVMLLSSASSIRKMYFLLEDSITPLQYQFDSTMVYKIRYVSVSHAHTGKYAGYNYDGVTKVFLDTVYAHIPDGQFVVNSKNTKSLVSRMLSERGVDAMDTMNYARDLSGKRIPDRYVYATSGDTIEVKPILYGALDKSNPYLGHKHILQIDLTDSCYYFAFATDTLSGRILGADSTVVLLAKGDTAAFLLEEVGFGRAGASAIGAIAQIRYHAYRLRSALDTTLYMSGTNPEKMTNLAQGLYFLKESPVQGAYYLALWDPSVHTIVVDSDTKQLKHARNDTIGSLFHIEKVARSMFVEPEEPDPFTYLTDFPDVKGKGFYRFPVSLLTSPHHGKLLTKNFYDYAALGLEGESMMTRAGTYSPNDLQLWVDTARGPLNLPDRPSFYIVKDVDTTAAGFNDFYIYGYFLHVMDSTSKPSHEASVIKVGGEYYNRLNFVRATRYSSNQLMLDNGRIIDANDKAINEYRFYLQKISIDHADQFYLVTEAGYGDGGQSIVRGYLSVENDTLYVGPRKNALPFNFARTVSNDVILIPPGQLDGSNEISIIGGTGQISILHAAGQTATVYNMLGRMIAQQRLISDNEIIPAARGILIVKTGALTRKVVVQ